MNIESKVCEKTTGNISLLLEQYLTSWNEKNAPCMAALFTDNAEFTGVDGKVITGKTQIENVYTKDFIGVWETASLKLTGIYARALSDAIVIITAKWEISDNDNSRVNNTDRNGIVHIIANKTTENGYRIMLQHYTELSAGRMENISLKETVSA